MLKTVRMDPELVARLDRAADERLVHTDVIVNRAVREFLDRLAPVDATLKTVDRPDTDDLVSRYPGHVPFGLPLP